MAKLSYGGIYWSTPAATANVNGVAIKAAGTTTAMELGDFTMPANNRLTYTGADTRVFMAQFAGSVSKAAGSSSETTYYLYLNGSPITGSLVGRTLSSSAEGAFAVSAVVELALNDYVELWLEVDSEDDLTIQNGVLSAHVLG